MYMYMYVYSSYTCTCTLYMYMEEYCVLTCDHMEDFYMYIKMVIKAVYIHIVHVK